MNVKLVMNTPPQMNEILKEISNIQIKPHTSQKLFVDSDFYFFDHLRIV